MPTGLKFPLTINNLGRFTVVNETNKIRQNALRILSTVRGERHMEPNAGTMGYDSLFRNFENGNGEIIAGLFKEALNAQEPRAIWNVRFVSVDNYGKAVFRIVFKLVNGEDSGTFTREFEVE